MSIQHLIGCVAKPCFKRPKRKQVQWCAPLVPALRRQRRERVCELEVYVGHSRPARVDKTGRAGKRAQKVKGLAAQTDNLSLIPGTHMVEGKN